MTKKAKEENAKYIRTKYGIHKILEEYKDHYLVKGGTISKNRTDYKVADSIEALCDEVVKSFRKNTSFLLSEVMINEIKKKGFKVCSQYLFFNNDIEYFGAIWITGNDSEPVLKSVVKFREDGNHRLYE